MEKTEPSSQKPLSRRSLLLRTLADLPRLLKNLGREIQRQGFSAAAQYTYDHLVRLISGAPPEQFSRITTHIHVGGQYSAAGLVRLRTRGISAVLNLREEFDDADAGIAPEHYLHLPIVDDGPFTFEEFQSGIAFIQERIANGQQIYVHCMLGIGRSATMAAAYLIAQGMSADEALATLRLRRPFIQPTEEQIQALHDLADQFAGAGVASPVGGE